jgi:hypothetical protein
LVNELVLALFATPFQLCHESPTDSFGDPYVAVDDPDEIYNRLAVRPAHVPNLRVGAKLDRAVLQSNILVLDEDFGIEGWEVMEKAFQNWKRWIMTVRDTESDVKLLLWVGLAEGRGKAIVK